VETKPPADSPSSKPRMPPASPIRRTHSTVSLPQAGFEGTTRSLRPTASLPQSLQTAHQSGPAIDPSEERGAVEDAEQLEMEVEKQTRDEDEPTKKIFCAGFPSASSLPPKPKEVDKFETSLKTSQSALELSFRHVMNFNAQKSAQPCNAEESGPETVKERKVLRRKHHSTGSNRLIKRHVVRGPEEEFPDDGPMPGAISFGSQAPAKPSLDPNKSGLFLYMDMHGHASKKGKRKS